MNRVKLMNNQYYDIIIVGGGPTGVALGLELGLHNINTLILEKHAAPLLSPRAQLINARSMELFIRWKLNTELKSEQIFSTEYPDQAVWCSKLNGKTYAISDPDNSLSDALSPEAPIRVPLYVTEKILRDKLKEFPCVNFLKQHEVLDINIKDENVTVVAINKSNQPIYYNASYVIACDGTNSTTRNKAGINFESLAKEKRVISVVFETKNFEQYITITKGCLFYLLDNILPCAIGSINPLKGLWYAQIMYQGNENSVDKINLDKLLNEVAGIVFPKIIIHANFWNMHIQLAQVFSKKNRVFLVGDSAHGFVPSGALGLNTGFVDVVNLGWKLAAVIKQQAKISLLDTYEQERYSICAHNLKLAQQNADAMVALKNQYDPETKPDEFSIASASLANQFSNSLGTTMGYAYFDSPLTQLNERQSTLTMSRFDYHPIAAPGYFLPHIRIDEEHSIYDILSPVDWTLIISGEHDLKDIGRWVKKINNSNITLQILNVKINSYSSKYILIRPDWHIAFTNNTLEIDYIESYLRDVYQSLTFQTTRSK